MYQEMFELHSELLSAIAHPKRLEIIHLLRDKSMNVTEMIEMLDLRQANLSQHLMILRKAGVVKTKKRGKQVIYELSDKKFIKASDLIREILVKRNANSKLGDELTLKMTDLLPVVRDVVCGMRLSPKTAAYAKSVKGAHYYFCAEGCFKRFEKNPDKFINQKNKDE